MYHNIRDNKGRFTKVVVPSQNIMSFSVTGSNFFTPPVQNADKEALLNKLRGNVFDVKYLDKFGTPVTRSLTLMPVYLTGYIGKGTSKKAPTDKVFAYDVDHKKFVGFMIDSIIDMNPV